MGLFSKLQLEGIPTIDWEMTPEYTFGTFESWGGVERIRSSNELVYYFFIDAWAEVSRLCLMERGIKHAKVIAEIQAPREMIDECVKEQGRVARFERTHAINERLKKWLKEHVVEGDDDSLIIPVHEDTKEELGVTDLPAIAGSTDFVANIVLPDHFSELSEEEVVSLIKQYNLVDHERNPEGDFSASLMDSGDGKTVVDRTTGLMWQREGLDIMSHRLMRKAIEEVNKEGFAGYNDWRMPSLAEGLSLMTREKQEKDQYLHPCFSSLYPFIFVDAQRKPGGYWFVDYKQGKSFWASGTIPGGFGRLCRNFKH